MKIEFIIHYGEGHTTKDLWATLESIKDKSLSPDKIRLCVNPPQDYVSYETFYNMVLGLLAESVPCYAQYLTSHNPDITDVINKTSELSDCDYYIFVNAGYKFIDREVVDSIRNNNAIFADPVDDQYNEFACNLKLHKNLGGFGKTHTLIEKIEHKLQSLEEAKAKLNAKSNG